MASGNGSATAERPKAQKPAKQSESPVMVQTRIVIPKMRIERVFVTLVGQSPLICHNWSQKAIQEMLDKQMGKAMPAKAPKDPQREFWESLYHLGGDEQRRALEHRDGFTYGFPSIAFKAAAVTACTSVSGITKVAARQAFHVDGEFVEIEGVPTMRQDMVRIGMGTADIRFRAEFKKWRVRLMIQHNANLLTAEQLMNLFHTAGFSVGIGDWRSEKDGSFGRFGVEEA